jgi:purine-binding chemotaxis protein CheW
VRPLAAVPEPDGDPLIQLCAFFVGDEEFAIDIMRVDEILQPRKPTPVPGAPSFVEGVLNLRGTILPVINLRQRLLAAAPTVRRKPKLVVCWLGRRRIALVVDGIAGVVREHLSDVKPPPPVVLAGRRPCIVGVTGGAERLRLLLDLRAVLSGGMSEEMG